MEDGAEDCDQRSEGLLTEAPLARNLQYPKTGWMTLMFYNIVVPGKEPQLSLCDQCA